MIGVGDPNDPPPNQHLTEMPLFLLFRDLLFRDFNLRQDFSHVTAMCSLSIHVLYLSHLHVLHKDMYLKCRGLK